MDNITIQSIHPEAQQMVVVFNIEGTEYPKVLPFFTVQDANLLKQQLQSFAKELRGEFDALKQAIQAQDQNQTPQVSSDVQALEGQQIPIDAGQADGGTPSTPATPASAVPVQPSDPNALANPAVPTDPSATPVDSSQPANGVSPMPVTTGFNPDGTPIV